MRKNLTARCAGSPDSPRLSLWKLLGRLGLALALTLGLAATGCKQAADQPPEEVDTDTPELDVTSGTKVDSVDEGEGGEGNESDDAGGEAESNKDG